MPPPIQKPPKSLLRQVGKAIADFDMIRDGDRILLGVSGGKDSLSLLHVLRHLQSYAPVRFELAVLTVDPEVPGFDPRPLTDYYDALGVPWHYEQQPIMEEAKERMDGDSFCAYCSRMKRGIMYRICRREGYGVLALAQHLDDLAESLLLSLFHGGQLRTMKARYVNDAGDVRIIRPLAYCRERQTGDFALAAGLPVVPDSCPACFSAPSQREHMKALLAREEQEHTHLFANILHAIKRLMTEAEERNMSTTTIRLPEDLKDRVAQVAERTGTTSHAFILDAIAERVDSEARRHEFHDTTERRFAEIISSGNTIPWSEIRTYLEDRLTGRAPARPAARKLGR